MVAYPFGHEKVQMQPLKKGSLRVVADTFRLIVKHVQTFSRSKIMPAYPKQGASSLQKLGFTIYHEGGVACRPILPNADATVDYTHNLVLTIPHEPLSIQKSQSWISCSWGLRDHGLTGQKSIHIKERGSYNNNAWRSFVRKTWTRLNILAQISPLIVDCAMCAPIEKLPSWPCRCFAAFRRCLVLVHTC